MKMMICALAAGVALAGSALGSVSTGFNTGFESWTSPNPLGLTWHASGGNPGGYIGFIDMGPANGGELIAPAAYLGDWSAGNGVGNISLDLTIFTLNGGVPFTTPTLTISGPGGSATWSGPVAPLSMPWTNFVAPLNQSSWFVSAGTWAGILSNVNSFLVDIAAATAPQRRA